MARKDVVTEWNNIRKKNPDLVKDVSKSLSSDCFDPLDCALLYLAAADIHGIPNVTDQTCEGTGARSCVKCWIRI